MLRAMHAPLTQTLNVHLTANRDLSRAGGPD